MQIVWAGKKPTASQLAQCQREILDLDLAAPEDLIFHCVWLEGEPDGPDHTSATIWGVEGSSDLHGKIHTREAP